MLSDEMKAAIYEEAEELTERWDDEVEGTPEEFEQARRLPLVRKCWHSSGLSVRRVIAVSPISFLAGTLNSVAAFSIAVASSGASTAPSHSALLEIF
jgi:hypothetical protein